MALRPLPISLALLGLIACKPEEVSAPASALSDAGTFVVIEPAPDHLRGRVALLAGARLYASPRFGSVSWALTLPEVPLAGDETELPRARALRVVGVSGDFVALTNDLAADWALGCGQPITGLEHLRMLFYVSAAHLAPILTTPLELEPLGDAGLMRVSAGARVSEPLPAGGMPNPGPGRHWRAIDADGLRALVPVPDDAVGLAWNPDDRIELESSGQLLFRDAEGNLAWLDDPGGDEVSLTLRNSCGELRQTITAADEIAGLRELALSMSSEDDGEVANYDDYVGPPTGPWRLLEGTDLRWTDGNLAGEVVAAFEIDALGQDWQDRRCFTLPLGEELQVVDTQPPVTCARPDQLEFVGDQVVTFDRNLEVEIGGSVRFGQPTVEGPWGPEVVRELLNGNHSTIAECLRPMAEKLEDEGLPLAGRWRLELEVDGKGRVVEALVEPVATGDDRVEDCLRAETGTWLLPPGAGKLIVALEFGDPTVLAGMLDEQSEPEPETKPKGKKPKPKDEKGKVMIIRDDEDDPKLEELPPSE